MYATQYISEFNNREGNAVKIIIQKKDGAEADNELTCMGCEVSYPNGDESKYNSIISAMAKLRFYSGINDTVTNETFLTDYYDEWRVTITVDTYKVFEGFIEPSEGGYVMKDRPYIIEVTCTDGLGLLKNIPLTDINEEDFVNRNTFISYIAGALAKTNLDLNIQTFCSIYNSSMNDRSDAIFYDLFNQAQLHHRTFLKSVNGFVSCYEALEIILKDAYSLYYWNGRWVISYRPELIDTIGHQYYTLYSQDGYVLSGNQITDTQINIGTNRLIYPINADQIISYQTPVKEVKTIFDYEVPEDLVNNEKMQRTGDFISPLNAYHITGWGQFCNFPHQETSVNNVTPRIKIETNPYGFELERYYILQQDTTTPNPPKLRNYIRNLNEDFFVEAGDKIEISFDWRLDANADIEVWFFDLRVLLNGLSPSLSNSWRVRNESGYWGNGTNGFPVGHINNIPGDLDLSEWQNFTTGEITFDHSGYIFLCFAAGNVPSQIHFKNLDINYITLAKGDRSNILKGDYWKTSKNDNIKDVIEDKSPLSDATRRILKGAIWNPDGVTLTNPTWYRYGVSEQKHYKELLNIGKFQHYKRRFKKIAGTFKGILTAPENNQIDFSPLSFHRHFTFFDDSQLKRYLLVPPLTIDYVSAIFNGIFTECYMNGEDKTYGDNRTFAYIF